MVQRINPWQNKSTIFSLAFLILLTVLLGCKSSVIDSNVEVSDRKWTYRDHVKAVFEIKDNSKRYNIYLKLRHTADYKYSNIFVLAHFIDGKTKVTKRYQYKLAKNDGEWLGSGSGNVFNYMLPLKTNYLFSKNGKYEIDIEQNMRDNPLTEITDLGVLVTETAN